MARTNVERVDESIEYIRKEISAPLAGKFGGINKEAAGKQISLKNFYYSKVGWDQQHKAVRALLLCHYHFLGVQAFPDMAKKYFKSKSKSDVNKYINAYVKMQPAAEDLARKAETYRFSQAADIYYHNRKREDNAISGGAIVCYTGVMLWLFQAGFLTMKGYTNNNVNVNNCNDILGNGVQWDLDRLDTVPRGHIWNFQGADSTICHWGISLGNGRAAGTNNTEEEQGVKVNFEGSGKMQYGRFDLQSMCEVLKVKYANIDDVQHGMIENIVKTKVDTKLFVIDPTTIVFQNDY